MKQFVVIGLGRFGVSVATELYKMGHEVLAIDSNVERIDEIADSVTHAVCADATDEAELSSLGLRNFDVAVVSIGSDLQASILVTMLCKELGVKFVLTKAKSELHAKVLQRFVIPTEIFPSPRRASTCWKAGMCWWPSVPMPTSPSWRIWPIDNGFSRKKRKINWERGILPPLFLLTKKEASVYYPSKTIGISIVEILTTRRGKA